MNKCLLSIIAILSLIGCADSGGQNQVPTHKSTSNKGSQGGISEKAQQEALKAQVLLMMESQSLAISEVKPSEVTLGLKFVLNRQNNIGFRKYNFNIQNGEELTLDNSQYDLTADSRLKIELYRFKKEGPQAKDLLAVQFQFENRAGSEAERAESSLVILVELARNKKSPLKTSFLFPTPQDFSLKKWADDSVKDSKPQ